MTSRVAQLIRYLVELVPGAGRTQIVKFLYLADHEARRHLGKPMTALRYRWDKFGPFDPEILRQVDSLERQGYLREAAYEFQGTVAYSYTATEKSAPRPFTKAELAILGVIVDRFGKMPLGNLLDDVVYQTRPMLEATRRGQRLRMELVDNEERIPGAELERVVAAVEQLDRGEGQPLEEVMAGLRSR
jgi:hypothetical protein